MHLLGMGETTYERTSKMNPNIVIIKDLKDSTNNTLHTIRGICKFFEMVQNANSGSCPHLIIDHRNGASYEIYMKKSVAMSP